MVECSGFEMKEIGGYFELELRHGEHYHQGALRLNTGRNCFEYILRSRQYRKVYIPYYTCEVMLEPLRKCNVAWEYYHINRHFEPVEAFMLQKDEAFLYTNYWGLKQDCVERLAGIYGSQLVVDNSQAFYAQPIDGIDTFYSARKFFGVPDGAYLYTDRHLDAELEQDVSYPRCAHLLRRIDESASQGYSDFRRDDEMLDNQPIKRMSRLTERLLEGIDYEGIKERRRKNFQYLHQALKGSNQLEIVLRDEDVPMIYPYLVGNGQELKKKLIENKVYVATYWGNVLEWCGMDALEYYLTLNLLPLPIDQRYNDSDMIKLLQK